MVLKAEYSEWIPWLLITWLLAWQSYPKSSYSWWRHQMETFPRYWPICAWTNGWANNQDAGDLRRHRAHYDDSVMWIFMIRGCLSSSWNQCQPMTKQIKNIYFLLRSDIIMGAMASLITSLTTVYSSVYSGADQRKHQSSASLVFVQGIHRWPVNSAHKWPVTRKMFPFDDVIMISCKLLYNHNKTKEKVSLCLFCGVLVACTYVITCHLHGHSLKVSLTNKHSLSGSITHGICLNYSGLGHSLPRAKYRVITL